MEGGEFDLTVPEVSEAPNIFSTMFSLLRPNPTEPHIGLFLTLPDVFSRQEALEGTDHSQNNPKRNKKNTACPHTNRKHYAKNMCNNCYHINGRNKNAWLCPHTNRLFYAKGKCQQCYLKSYYSEKTAKRNRSRERQED